MAGASSALKSKRELGKATRDAFGRALEALGAEHPDLVVVDHVVLRDDVLLAARDHNTDAERGVVRRLVAARGLAVAVVIVED